MRIHSDSSRDLSQSLQWIVTTALGAAFGFGSVGTVLPLFSPLPNVDGDKLFGILLAPMLGLGIGSIQWLVIRKDISQAGWWPAANVVGYSAAAVLASLTDSLRLDAIAGDAGSITLMLIMGFAVGLPQYLVLKIHFARAGLWVLANGVGMLSYGLGGIIPAHNLTDLVALGSIMGALYGAIEGIAWRLMSTRPIVSLYG